MNVEPGDRLLLCSDGLHGMLLDSQIADILLDESSPQMASNRLIEAALAAGGHDNVTVVVADVTGFAEHRRSNALRKANRTALIFGIVIAAILAAMLVGIALVMAGA